MIIVLRLPIPARAQVDFGSTVQISFGGPDVVHLDYDVKSSQSSTVRVDLFWKDGAGKRQLLDSSSSQIKGTKRLTGLTGGPHSFITDIVSRDTRGNEFTNSGPSAVLDFPPDTYAGKLLFDESLAGGAQPRLLNVEVPPNLSLSLEGFAKGTGASLSGSGSVTLNHSHFKQLRLSTNGVALLSSVSVDESFFIPPKLKATINDSFFRSTQTSAILGASTLSETAPVQIRNCEFYAGIDLEPRTVTLENNMILGAVTFKGTGWNNALSSVVIQGNSFLGVSALEYSGDPLTSTIAIGANYYGDLKGPNTWNFGGGRGALLDARVFAVASGKFNQQAVQNRKFPSQTDIEPTIGLVGIRIGQNTLDSESNYYIRQGRPFLVSVDLSTSWKQLDGVLVYAELNGTRYNPEQQVSIYRDLFDCSGNFAASGSAVASGQTTYNIILPAVQTNNASLKVFMDTRGVAAIANGVLLPLFSRDLTLRPAPARKLNLAVVPVRIGVRGYPTNTPSALLQARSLQAFLPAMLPLRADEISITTDPAITYDASDAGFFDGWSVTSLCYTVTEYLESYMDEFNSMAEPAQRIDRLIGVIPDGTLGAEGVNVMTSRRVSLVEEGRPLAAIHELGHSFGLYTSKEQYDLRGYPNGYPVTSATVFLPEPDIDIASFPRYANYGRIHHISRSLGELAYDVMGNTDPAWLVPSTLAGFGQQLENLLRTPVPLRSQAHASATLQSTTPAPATRRIYVRGAYARLGVPWPWDTNILCYTFLRDTLTAMDVTALNKSPIKPYNAGKSNRVQFQPFDTNGFSVWSDYAWVNFDNPASRFSPLAYWSQTFDISTNVAGFDIRDSDGGPGQISGGPFLTVDSRRKPVIHLLSPVPGQSITDKLVLQVSAQAGTNEVSLNHLLFLSTDNGATWTQAGGIRRGNHHELDTEFLPAGKNLSFKIISGDAFNTAENRVDNLTVANRAPHVRILSPRPDDQGSAGIHWLLQASAVDVEDGLLAGQWTSSLDGKLGNGNTLTNVRLSPGTHDLTFSAKDSQGSSAESRVRVLVQATDPTAPDLQLPESALKLVPTGAPFAIRRLTTGQTNILHFEVFNDGADADALVRVYIQPPQGSETQIAAIPLMVPAFSTAEASASCAPAMEGNYVVRAEITDADPPDSDSSNNTRSWSVPAEEPGIQVQILPPEAAAAGAQWRVDQQSWQDSAAKVLGANLSNIDQHFINCKQISGWFAPPAHYIEHDPLAPVSLVMVYRRNLGDPPWFTTQPKSQTVAAGTNLTLRCSVSGTPTPVLSWYRDGVLLSGATYSSYPGSASGSLKLTNVQPAQAGVYTVVATNAAGVVTSEPATVTVLFTGANFASWATGQKLPPNASGPADDPDQDGFPNILEYALALDPNSPENRNELPKPALVQSGGQLFITYTYRRPKTAPADLIYQVTASSALDPWQGTTTGLETSAPVDKGSYVEVTVKSIIPATGNASGFIQFKVIKNSP